MSDKIRLNKAFVTISKTEYLPKLLNLLKEAGVEIFVTSDFYNYCVENSVEVHIATTSEIYHLLESGSKDVNLVILNMPNFASNPALSEKELFDTIDTRKLAILRLAAKRFNDILVIPSVNHLEMLSNIIKNQDANSTLNDRRKMASEAFSISSGYDVDIFNYLNDETNANAFKLSISGAQALKYGENPHQEAKFYGKLNELFDVVSELELTYNNLLNINTLIDMVAEFTEPTFIILKHTNASGIASRQNLIDAWYSAMENDPISATRSFIATNSEVDTELALLLSKVKFTALIAPSYTNEAKEILRQLPNQMVLIQKKKHQRATHIRSLLNGVLVQTKDFEIDNMDKYQTVSVRKPSENELFDLNFANKIAKHSKTNAIILVKNKQLIANGNGQTSRVDSLLIALMKAKSYDLSLEGAVLASDVPLPFTDIVQIAAKEGIKAIIQPGGTQTDKDVTAYCNEKGIAMIHTGIRHIKH